MDDLQSLADRLRNLPGVRAKADIALVADVFGGGDWYAGPGDDGAVLPAGEGQVVVGRWKTGTLDASARASPRASGGGPSRVSGASIARPPSAGGESSEEPSATSL